MAQTWRMSRRPQSRGTAAPLDGAALHRLAISYVGRYAVTRAMLARYLRRKLAERGWAEDGTAPVAAIVEKCARLGYVDDAAFAAQRGATLARRGFGAARIRAALRAAGVEPEEAGPDADAAALAAALVFARRKRLGPYAEAVRDRDQQRRDLGAMLRAGHAPELARRIVGAASGEMLD